LNEEFWIIANGLTSSKLIKELVILNEAINNLIKKAMERMGLSARADRILKVSRSIADLEGEKDVQSHHLSEAIHYRSLDRESWGA
jgi:magnesium chelatase family protein